MQKYLKQRHGVSNVAPHPALARNPNLILINRSLDLRLLHFLVPIHALRNRKTQLAQRIDCINKESKQHCKHD